MLKQSRSTRQPRTHANTERDRETDAYSASSDRNPLYRYKSGLDSYEEALEQELNEDIDEKLTLKGQLKERINRTEKEQTIRPQGQSYHAVHRPGVQSGSSNQNGEDDYNDIDHSGRPPNGTFNPTRIPPTLREDSYYIKNYRRDTDIFEGRLAEGIEETDLDYDVEPRIPDPSSRAYKPSRVYSQQRYYTPVYRSHGEPIEAAQLTRGTRMPKKVEQELHPFRELVYAQEMREREEGLDIEQWARQNVEQALQEEAEAAERFWRAENHEWPGVHLRGMYSLSKLYNKDTISRDSTIGNEARMDDLLACVGKRMMKIPFLKESRDETSNDGEEVEGDGMRSGIRDTPGVLTEPSSYPGVGEGYQSRSQLIEPSVTLPHGINFQHIDSMAEAGESENKYEHITPTPSPRPIWAGGTPRRPATVGNTSKGVHQRS